MRPAASHVHGPKLQSGSDTEQLAEIYEPNKTYDSKTVMIAATPRVLVFAEPRPPRCIARPLDT